MGLAVLVASSVLLASPHRPTLLGQLQASALQAYVDAEQGDWDRVAGDVTGFEDSWATYRERAQRMDTALSRHLSAAAQKLLEAKDAKDPMALRQVANTLAHLLAPLVDDVTQSPGLAELLPLEREVALSADQGAWDRARRTARAAHNLFLAVPCGRRLRPQLRRALKAQEAALATESAAELKAAEASLEALAGRQARACSTWRPAPPPSPGSGTTGE